MSRVQFPPPRVNSPHRLAARIIVFQAIDVSSSLTGGSMNTETEAIKNVFENMKRPYSSSGPEYSEWIYLKLCCTEDGISRISRVMVTVPDPYRGNSKKFWELSMRIMEDTFCNRGLAIPQQIEDAINLELQWLDKQKPEQSLLA